MTRDTRDYGVDFACCDESAIEGAFPEFPEEAEHEPRLF
jgi:hypothetical protein